MSKQDVGKGAAYVYIETVISMISGYVFWFVMAKITTSEIIGISSTIVSLATIFITIVTIGIPNGVQRFLGKSFFEQKIEDAKVFVKASLFLITVGIVVCSSVILFAQNWFFTTFGIDFNLVAIAVLLMASSAITCTRTPPTSILAHTSADSSSGVQLVRCTPRGSASASTTGCIDVVHRDRMSAPAAAAAALVTG